MKNIDTAMNIDKLWFKSEVHILESLSMNFALEGSKCDSLKGLAVSPVKSNQRVAKNPQGPKSGE